MAAPLAVVAKWAAKKVFKEAAKRTPGGAVGVVVLGGVGTAFIGMVITISMISAIASVLGNSSTSFAAVTSCTGNGTAEASEIPGIPALPLQVYQQVGRASGIDWPYLAAVGKVESQHGTFMGRTLLPNGDITPPVIGIALNGQNKTKAIRDTDRGALDGDTTWDRAVGPMQFLPTSWTAYGGDGNADGVKNPQNYYDAVTGAAQHLIGGGAPANMNAAIFGYNNSNEYVATVLAYAEEYRAAAALVPSRSPAPAPSGGDGEDAPPSVVLLPPSPAPVFPGLVPAQPAPARPAPAVPAGPRVPAAPAAAPSAPAAPVPDPSASPTRVMLSDQCGRPFEGTTGGDGSWGGHSNGMIPQELMAQVPWAPHHRLRADAATSLASLNVAYKAAFGSDVCITDSYRTYAEQVDVKRRKPKLAADPGTSNHGWGMALDLCGGVQSFGTPQHNWWRANAARFGWVHPPWAQINGSKPEAWHWQFGLAN